MSLMNLKNYTLIENIGNGSFAAVYKAYPKADKSHIVAIKCIDISNLSKSAIDNIITEIEVLKLLKHEHIVQMEDFFLEKRYICIVMEYCNGGDLRRYLRKRKKLPEKVCQKFLQQLALGLKFLHSHKVCHMDLKPPNIFIMKKPRLILKIGDFGFAQFVLYEKSLSNVRGSPLYMAPEMLFRQKYDARADLWSVGILMYECLFGRPPFFSPTLKGMVEIMQHYRGIQLPAGFLSSDCRDLIESLLRPNPNDRISFDNFFSHKFLNLTYAPTSENYEKSVEIITKAIRADTEGNTYEAFHLYCEALRYFIPQLRNEGDPLKTKSLKKRINEYLERAEKLKLAYFDTDNEAVPSSSRHQTRQEIKPTTIDPELRTLSKTTSDIAVALELGEVGEQYMAENNYELALEKLTTSLGILLRVIDNEPVGKRKMLIHHQLNVWMKKAEYVKDLLSIHVAEESTKTVELQKDQCLLQ